MGGRDVGCPSSSRPHPTACRLELVAFFLTASRSARGSNPLDELVLVEKICGTDAAARDGAHETHGIGEARQALGACAFFEPCEHLRGPCRRLDTAAVDRNHDYLAASAGGQRFAGCGRRIRGGVLKLEKVIASRAVTDDERKRDDWQQHRHSILVEEKSHSRQHRAEQEDQHHDIGKREHPFRISEVDVQREPSRHQPQRERQQSHERCRAVAAPEDDPRGRALRHIAGAERRIRRAATSRWPRRGGDRARASGGPSIGRATAAQTTGAHPRPTTSAVAAAPRPMRGANARWR